MAREEQIAASMVGVDPHTERLFDVAAHLNVFTFLDKIRDPRRGISLHVRWKRTELAKDLPERFLRRCVDVAVKSAIDAVMSENVFASSLAAWDEKKRVSENLSKSLLAFFEAWEPTDTALSSEPRDGQSGKVPYSSTARANISNSIRGMHIQDPRLKVVQALMTPTARFQALLESQAERDIESLSHVYDFSVAFSNHSRKIAKAMRAGRQNPGQPGKQAFVRIMAEAWMCLTGRLPGSGSEENPFAAFVAEAWKDASNSVDGTKKSPSLQTIRKISGELRRLSLDPGADTYPRPFWCDEFEYPV